MQYHASAATHTGRVRDRNEDYFLVDQELGLYLVCDGMGGHNAGDVASRMAAGVIIDAVRGQAALLRAYAEEPKNRLRRKVRGVIERAVQDACHAVWKAAMKDKGKQGMGTTLAMMLVCGRNAFVAHVGDSRVYLVRNQSLCQLTEDHTLINDMLREGIVTWEQARKHPHSNALTRAIGVQPAVRADILHVEMMLGDRYIICSDGLSNYMDGDALLGAVQRRRVINDLAELLVAQANDRGGKDNVTAVVVAVDDEGREPSAEHSAIVARKIDALRGIPMFAAFDYKQMVKFLEIGEVRAVKPGEVLIREGEEDAAMYIILYGRADVLKGDQIVNRLAAGDYFGEMSLIDKVPRSATVVATQPMTFLVLERDHFFGLLQTDASMATKVFWSFTQKLNRRLRQADDEVYRLRKALTAYQS